MTMYVRFLALACLVALSAPLVAEDWPQFRGPDRTDISKETGLLKSWPKEGPRLVWNFTEAGAGYSGIAVVGNTLYSGGADEQNEFVFAIDATTGKKLWSQPIGPRFINGWGDGPRSTPTVDGDRLYVLGGQGNLTCLKTKDGSKVWGINMQKDLGGQMMSGWGYCESVLIDGDRVVCCPGGNKGTMATLDKMTGKVVWRSTELKDKATYASIIIATVGGMKQYVQTTFSPDGKGGFATGVAAKDGKLLWHVEESGYRTAVIPTPIFHDNCVFVSAGYGAGCDLIKLTLSPNDAIMAEKVYSNKVMVNHHGGVVLVGEYLYGYSDGKGWVCQDFKTGTAKWEEKRALSKGSVTYADGHLYCYSEKDGTLVLAKATPEGWKEDGRFSIPQKTKLPRKSGQIWTHPVIANGKLYLRDQDLLFCFDIRGTAVGQLSK